MNHISWIYHNSTTTLENASNDSDKKYYKLSWLSAKIIIHPANELDPEEFDIDPFLSTFMVKTTEDSPPTLSILFNAWCAYKKHWFQTNSTVEFYVIDEMGEDQIYELLEHNFSLVVKKNKLSIS